VRRIIQEAELAELNHQLILGLERFIKQQLFQGPKKMRKQKTQNFPAAEFNDRLSSLLAAAANSGLNSDDIASTLERHAVALRVHSAKAWRHPSAPATYEKVGGSGNLVQRLSAAIRGEYALDDDNNV
jgi:hypothetical protein